jgi:hypothetical protein
LLALFPLLPYTPLPYLWTESLYIIGILIVDSNLALLRGVFGFVLLRGVGGLALLRRDGSFALLRVEELVAFLSLEELVA